MEKIKVGISGCGHLGSIHAKLIKEISDEQENIQFAGVYDIDILKAEELALKHKLRAFRSQEEMFGEINSLIIATPTSTHFQIASEALLKGINLFIEKPVTATEDEAKKLIELRDNTKIKIQVGHIERFNPALISLSDFELNPMFIEAHRLSEFSPRGTDVSVVHDLMIHDLDIIFHLIQSGIAEINANGVAVLSESIDIANARLKFSNGCVANLTASRISLKKMRKMRLFMKNLYVSMDFLQGTSDIFRLADLSEETEEANIKISDNKKIILTQFGAEHNYNPMKKELQHFFRSIIENKHEKVSLEEAMKAVETAEKIIGIINQG